MERRRFSDGTCIVPFVKRLYCILYYLFINDFCSLSALASMRKAINGRSDSPPYPTILSLLLHYTMSRQEIFHKVSVLDDRNAH